MSSVKGRGAISLSLKQPTRSNCTSQSTGNKDGSNFQIKAIKYTLSVNLVSLLTVGTNSRVNKQNGISYRSQTQSSSILVQRNAYQDLHMAYSLLRCKNPSSQSCFRRMYLVLRSSIPLIEKEKKIIRLAHIKTRKSQPRNLKPRRAWNYGKKCPSVV